MKADSVDYDNMSISTDDDKTINITAHQSTEQQ